MLDIHKLNIFLVAAETLNFTHTAKKLRMTQPSVSQHIQALEDHFHTPLFLRTGRRLELSNAGLSLIPLAREAVRLSIHIDETITSLNGELQGHLHVCCSTSIGKYILPNLLAQFHQKHPRIQVTCQVASEKKALEMLYREEVHLTLSGFPEHFSHHLESQMFVRDTIRLIAPLNHPWANVSKIDTEDLLGTEFILREEESGTYQAVETALSKVDISIRELPILLTLGNSEAIALSVREGIGVGFVSEMIVDIFGKDQVSCIDIFEVNIFRDIYTNRKQSFNYSVPLRAFWDFLQEINYPEMGSTPLDIRSKNLNLNKGY